ncbi:hypothetical protein K2173_002714 [Erythroxylum novogranatense]|uniref:Uncharacterized protein n=1 Tax=Erythroxylum novogranatense TaxID=1862640 RepID=A0AAV8SWV8_9ROSI|nr:hypothetical protein K2173_002714 [Erythroxylum novogranatense]
MSSRHRPLHTCGACFIAIAHKACTKAQDIKGPVGSVTKKMARVASEISPFFYAFQCQLLASLVFLDDRILGLEKTIEAIFPPSGQVFDKVDQLVEIIEVLPEKFDDAVDKFPLMIHQVPFLDWALVLAISWLNFWLSILIQLGSRSAKEKEIIVDIKCDESNESANNKTQSDALEKAKAADIPKAETETLSYKDALEKGTKEKTDKEEEDGEAHKTVSDTEETKEEVIKQNNEQNRKMNIASKGDKEVVTWEGEDKTAKVMSDDDQILELFESAWLRKPSKKIEDKAMPRSASNKL